MGEPYDQVNFSCTQCGRPFCTENYTGDKSRDGMCNGCTGYAVAEAMESVLGKDLVEKFYKECIDPILEGYNRE